MRTQATTEEKLPSFGKTEKAQERESLILTLPVLQIHQTAFILSQTQDSCWRRKVFFKKQKTKHCVQEKSPFQLFELLKAERKIILP